MTSRNSGTKPRHDWGDSARPIVLTIAGFDPSSGAGVTADLKTLAAHHLYGIACITALTVQSTLGVQSVHPLSSGLIRDTLACLREDFVLAGVKIGMLGSGEVVTQIASFLRSEPWPCERRLIVFDPVLRSSSGAPLIDREGLNLIRKELLAVIGWLTPNRAELAALNESGIPAREDIPKEARRLQSAAAALGNSECSIVVTGGDLDAPDDFLLTSDGEERWLSGESVSTTSTHGTGCAFSTALLAGLVAGAPPIEAAHGAKRYVTAALRSAYPIGKGNGPLNHFFRLD